MVSVGVDRADWSELAARFCCPLTRPSGQCSTAAPRWPARATAARRRARTTLSRTPARSRTIRVCRTRRAHPTRQRAFAARPTGRARRSTWHARAPRLASRASASSTTRTPPSLVRLSSIGIRHTALCIIVISFSIVFQLFSILDCRARRRPGRGGDSRRGVCTRPGCLRRRREPAAQLQRRHRELARLDAGAVAQKCSVVPFACL